jgi:N-acetyl-anhydromuramyl-L-alanine amidase AmpD
MQQLSGQQAQLQAQVQQLFAQTATPPGGPLAPPAPPARPGPLIQNITTQLKRDPNKQFPTRSRERIQMIIIHHTAVAPTIGAERIAEHRVDKQGWPGIGYHYFITPDGQIQQTNELITEAAHAGVYNPISIGICFAGDFTTATPTPAQLDAGAQLIAWLLGEFKLSLQGIFGYKELINTQSPGLQWDSGARWGDQLKERVQAYL